jgi:hypothetical protein
MWNEDLYKRFGWWGVVALVIILAIGWLLQVRLTHSLELSAKPAALVIQVTGAVEPLQLKLDHRSTDAPRSTEFFRLEQIQPGQHLVELLGAKSAVYSRYAQIMGGKDNLFVVNLVNTTNLPNIQSIPDGSGWIYLGSKRSGRLQESPLSLSSTIPSVGDLVSLDEPGFVRTSPADNANSDAISGGDAFSQFQAGSKVEIAQVKQLGSEYWAKVISGKEEQKSPAP